MGLFGPNFHQTPPTRIKIYTLMLHSDNIKGRTSLIDTGDELLRDLTWWKEIRGKIPRGVSIETRKIGGSDAHFNAFESTRDRVVIEMPRSPKGKETLGSIAHELTHAVQWLTNDMSDLFYITDVTRDLNKLSPNSLIWKRLLFAIYLSYPQECQAWQSGIVYYREPVLDEILPWMREFNPIEAERRLYTIKPSNNPWGIRSFSELPDFWADAYEEYGEKVPGSFIPSLKGKSLLDFLNHYSSFFKNAVNRLEIKKGPFGPNLP